MLTRRSAKGKIIKECVPTETLPNERHDIFLPARLSLDGRRPDYSVKHSLTKKGSINGRDFPRHRKRNRTPADPQLVRISADPVSAQVGAEPECTKLAREDRSAV